MIKLKKLVSIVFTILLICGTIINVCAAQLLNCTAVCDPLTSVVTISGSHSLLSNGYVTVLAKNTLSEVFRDEKKVDSDGSFLFTFNMTENDSTDMYTVIIGGNNIETPVILKYGFAKETDKTDLLEALKTTDNPKSVINGHEMVYGLNIEGDYFKSLSNQNQIYNALTGSFATLGELQDRFNTAVAIASFNKEASGDTKLIDDFKAILNLKTDETSYYGMLSNKSLVVSGMTNQNFQIADAVLFAAEFDKKSAFELINSFDSSMRDRVYEITQKLINDGYISSNIAELTNDAIKELIALKPYSSFSDYANKIVTAIANSKKTAGGGSTGGISGGKVSGSATVTPQAIVPTPVQSSYFNDLNSVEWAKTAVEALYEKGVVEGDGSGNFEPLRNVSRAEFVKMLVVALDFEISSASGGFNDIFITDWYYSYIVTGKENGLIEGISETEFDPNALISREQMSAIVYRAVNRKGFKLPYADREFDFSDFYSISEYARASVEALYQGEILNGVSESSFDPASPATRAMAAKVIYEILERCEA